MSYAISEAHKAVGRTAENPPVGCVIIATAGQRAGVGRSARQGRPHAEPVALAMAAEPPAESPSTRNISVLSGSRIEQSASLPGKDAPSSKPFLRVSSLAFRAASRARPASTILSITRLATSGFSSKYCAKVSDVKESTIPCT